MRDDRFKRLVDAVCDHGGRFHCLLNVGTFVDRRELWYPAAPGFESEKIRRLQQCRQGLAMECAENLAAFEQRYQSSRLWFEIIALPSASSLAEMTSLQAASMGPVCPVGRACVTSPG